MTKRPTYVLKDFPEDYIPIDKKTTTHHHYIWIQNISWPMNHGPYLDLSVSSQVHVHSNPRPQKSGETF